VGFDLGPGNGTGRTELVVPDHIVLELRTAMVGGENLVLGNWRLDLAGVTGRNFILGFRWGPTPGMPGPGTVDRVAAALGHHPSALCLVGHSPGINTIVR
jgi:hypothetical protein